MCTLMVVKWLTATGLQNRACSQTYGRQEQRNAGNLTACVIGAASALLKANGVTRPTTMIGDCARLITPWWSRSPREDLSVCAATPRFTVVERVLKNCHSSGQGERWAEHGTCGRVRLQDRGRVEVPTEAMLVFAVPSSWRNDSTISSPLRVVGHLTEVRTTGLNLLVSCSSVWSAEETAKPWSSRMP